MKLVITEKPSVAQSLAKVLGADSRRNGYLEGKGYLVSWCIGHLVELSKPEAYDTSYAKWTLTDLPIIPDAWKYQISQSTKKQFMILKQLMKRDDVESLICATDAGREGELIFRLVYHQAGCTKPFERLWISSMEDAAIKAGFADLKPGTAYDSLYQAALCRERADWLVGMNATRLFSCIYGQTLNVGRVMTPTLAMVVMRDVEIKTFRAEPFFTVKVDFDHGSAVSRRFSSKEDAMYLFENCKKTMHAEVKKIERKEKTEQPPLLYDLTSLQRDANRILGYTAKQTLDYAQSLYEKKYVTYPRTDSRYLTEDMRESVEKLVQSVAEKYGINDFTTDFVDYGHIIQNKKVTDHHAIIPTKFMCKTDLKALPDGEYKLLQLISVRLLCAMGQVHRYTEEQMVLLCGEEEFTAKSRAILINGWKDIEQKFYPVKQNKEPMLQDDTFMIGENILLYHVDLKEGKTTAPKRFTEDTLLSSMEHAGENEMAEGVERKGLGTPATRAGIIEKLVQKGFMERTGDKKTKYLISTEKGNALIKVMPEQILSASMTADWEQKLLQIEQNEYRPERFMEEIVKMIEDLVKNRKRADES